MKRHLLFLHSIILFLSFSLKAYSQSVRYSISMPYISLAAYSSKQTDVFSFTGNQAALAKIKKAGAGLYTERRFLLSEISVYGLALALPSRQGNFGLQVNYSGFVNFNENKIGLAYGRSVGSLLDIGVQFNYIGYRVPAYGNASTISFEAGAIAHLSKTLNAGLHIYNPVGGKLGKNTDEKFASVFKFGFGYDASEQFYISTEIVKEEDKGITVTAGMQYNFMKQFFVRAGFLSGTAMLYTGAGISWKNFRLDLSGSYHPQLGITPGLLLLTSFKDASK